MCRKIGALYRIINKVKWTKSTRKTYQMMIIKPIQKEPFKGRVLIICLTMTPSVEKLGIGNMRRIVYQPKTQSVKQASP